MVRCRIDDERRAPPIDVQSRKAFVLLVWKSAGARSPLSSVSGVYVVAGVSPCLRACACVRWLAWRLRAAERCVLGARGFVNVCLSARGRDGVFDEPVRRQLVGEQVGRLSACRLWQWPLGIRKG